MLRLIFIPNICNNIYVCNNTLCGRKICGNCLEIWYNYFYTFTILYSNAEKERVWIGVGNDKLIVWNEDVAAVKTVGRKIHPVLSSVFTPTFLLALTNPFHLTIWLWFHPWKVNDPYTFVAALFSLRDVGHLFVSKD